MVKQKQDTLKNDIKLQNQKTLTLLSNIEDSKIVYPTLIEKMKKLVGNRIIDILLHIPYNYELLKKVDNIKQIKNGEYCCVELIVIDIKKPKVPFYIAKKKHIPTTICCKTTDGILINLIYFNAYPATIDSFFIGRKIICQGKLSIDKNEKYTIIHPHQPVRIQDKKGVIAIYKLNKLEEIGIDINNFEIETIFPLYSLVEGIKQQQVISSISKILNQNTFNFSVFDKCDYLINQTNESQRIPTFKDAISRLHFPQNIQDIESKSIYRKKLAFLELLSFKVALSLARKNKTTEKGNIINGNGEIRQKFLKNLSFTLTKDQEKCLKEIYQDQASDKKMLRLLQGDVGSGKTIIAIMACLNTVESGKKAIIMAPTSILAKQHFATILKYCYGLNIQVELLIGETKQKTRQDILSRLKLGMVDILVGTHTLFQKKIDLPNNIGLFVIDEQHNFGVEQRVFLINKCSTSDILMMSATPIPRTMIMALYGDVQTSMILEKPANRKPIDTKVISFEDKYMKLVEAIKRKIDANEKIYWVCPLVDESDKLDYIDVKTRYNELSNIIGSKNTGLLHGKMSQEAKDKVMLDFKNGEIKLLVSTTVIEVGVDVPDATIIVIENAEKFGLSQLHQLRGRVGRGDKKSYCFLLYGKDVSETGKKRLEILKNNDNGFAIADADLKIRGGGAILGKKQSGFNTMNFVDFVADKEMIKHINSVNINNEDIDSMKEIIELFHYDLNENNLTNC